MNDLNWFKFVFSATILLSFSACEDRTTCCLIDVPPPTLLHYVSIEVGSEQVYQLDSIIYDDFSGTVDTLRHWRRELTVNTFRDLENRLNYRQEIYVRKDTMNEWQKVKVRSVFLNESRFEVKEDNITKVKLRYPIKQGAQWDANVMNTLEEQNYTYKGIFEKEKLAWKCFTTVLLVNQIDEGNLIEKRFAEEKYAPQYGLISRRDLNITTSFDGEILSGYDCRWVLLESH